MLDLSESQPGSRYLVLTRMLSPWVYHLLVTISRHRCSYDWQTRNHKTCHRFWQASQSSQSSIVPIEVASELSLLLSLPCIFRILRYNILALVQLTSAQFIWLREGQRGHLYLLSSSISRTRLKCVMLSPSSGSWIVTCTVAFMFSVALYRLSTDMLSSDRLSDISLSLIASSITSWVCW